MDVADAHLQIVHYLLQKPPKIPLLSLPAFFHLSSHLFDEAFCELVQHFVFILKEFGPNFSSTFLLQGPDEQEKPVHFKDNWLFFETFPGDGYFELAHHAEQQVKWKIELPRHFLAQENPAYVNFTAPDADTHLLRRNVLDELTHDPYYQFF